MKKQNEMNNKSRNKLIGLGAGIMIGAMALTGCGDSEPTNDIKELPTPTPIEEEYTDHATIDDIEEAVSDFNDESVEAEEAEFENDGEAMLDDFIKENGLEAYRDQIFKAYGGQVKMITHGAPDGATELIPEGFSFDFYGKVECTFYVHYHDIDHISNSMTQRLGTIDPDTGEWRFRDQ